VRQNKNARQGHFFVVRLKKRTAKREKNLPAPGANGSPSVSTQGRRTLGEKSLPCAMRNAWQTQGFAVRPKKRTANNFFPCVFSLPCALYKTHGKEVQRFSRTAKLGFPVVRFRSSPCHHNFRLRNTLQNPKDFTVIM
jgi:hypothetical protein